METVICSQIWTDKMSLDTQTTGIDQQPCRGSEDRHFRSVGAGSEHPTRPVKIQETSDNTGIVDIARSVQRLGVYCPLL